MRLKNNNQYKNYISSYLKYHNIKQNISLEKINLDFSK